MKQTPQIVIEPKQINSCADCPFFEEDDNMDIYNYGRPPEFTCQHPAIRGNWGKSIPERGGWFETIKGTQIWVECPLPDVEEGE